MIRQFYETAVQRRAQFQSQDFVFDLNTATAEVGNGGGSIRRAFVTQFPALAGQGLGYSLFVLHPCGVNLPHVHPRATELLFMINGTGPMRTTFVEENVATGPSRDVQNDIYPGQVTFFPQGLIHLEQNLGCDDVTFLSALNSEDPGVNTVTLRLFDVTDDEGLATSLGITPAQVATLRQELPPSPAKGRAECLAHCAKKGYGGTPLGPM